MKTDEDHLNAKYEFSSGLSESRSGSTSALVWRSSMLMLPEHLTDVSSWHRHIPFAFWCIDELRPRMIVELGTHKGDSYCAFCQAVDRLSLGTRCFAIDTWEGDPHSGKYGPEVYTQLAAYHNPRYGHFSLLMKSSFDDAVNRFTDGCIDLLHVDGFHTYDAVKHDLETWLPKLSNDALVLVHDIAVHDRDFGVWRAWAELCRKYPSFDFVHGHGLGILAMGGKGQEAVNSLRSNAQRARHVFSRLGEMVVERRDGSTAQHMVQQRDQELARTREDAAAAQHMVQQRDQELARTREDAAAAQHMVQQRDQELARTREDAAVAQHMVRQRDQELARTREDAAVAQRMVQQRGQELARSRGDVAVAQHMVQQRDQELARTREDAAAAQHMVHELDEELQSLRVHVTREGELNSLHAKELAASQSEAEALRQTVRERERVLGSLDAKLLELRESVSWRLTRPLREVHRCVDRLRRSLWPRKYRFRLLPVSQLRSIDSALGKWEAQGPNPKFLLIHDSIRYPSRWCEVRIILKNLDGERPVFHIDAGGFGVTSAVALPPPNNGGTRAVVELPRYARAFQLEPCQRAGRFEMKNVVISEISRGKAEQLKRCLNEEAAVSQSGQPSANGTALRPEVSANAQPSGNDGPPGSEISAGMQPSDDGGAPGPDVLAGMQPSADGGAPEPDVSAGMQPSADGGPLGLDVSASMQPSDDGGAPGLDVKVFVRDRLKAEFGAFLASGAELVLPQPQAPLTSIVLVLYNQAELTYNCLCSIVAHAGEDSEIIIIDNASTDATAELLKRVHGAIVVRNAENRYFPPACNQASEHARGKYMLLLNNDAQLLPGSLQAAVSVLEQDESIGAVGGRILNLTGCLQEAGSIIWSDGSTLGYGRGDVSERPEYMFRREVDFCSAAFLLTRTRLFREAGGFDEVFSPAYYEEVDFCTRLWEHGLRVVYEPRVAIVHFEYGSSDPAFAGTVMARNRQILCSKHAGYLATREPSGPKNELRARHARAPRLRILFIDDCIPHLDQGSGYPRANAIANAMIRMGFAVTLFPMVHGEEPWQRVYRDLLREIEIMADASADSLGAFLQERRGEYDVIFVSRPHNMQYLLNVLGDKSLFNGGRLIYDAEAVFALRTQERARILGKGDSEAVTRELMEELELAGKADEIVCVSEVERRHFVERGLAPVHILGHSLEPKPTANTFEERHDILFVGAMNGSDSPNEDSVLWFSKDVLPLVRAKLASADVRLIVVGQNTLQRLSTLADDPSVELFGSAEDLSPYYERARIFVGPTRFAAGIPIKLLEVAARGVPIVATALIAAQLGWVEGEQLLTAPATDPERFADQCVRLYSDKELWLRLREDALARMREDCSPERFVENLQTILARCMALEPMEREMAVQLPLVDHSL